MDITSITFPDQSFDVICCSHVMEHVTDDRQAMREIHRVLKDDGWAILLVPITAEKTFEHPTITFAEGRHEAFGQEDHVRIYGPPNPRNSSESDGRTGRAWPGRKPIR